MKLDWQKSLRVRPRQLLEEAGYHEFRDPNTKKISYILRLGSRYYPRYHVYIKEYTNGGAHFDLHIDQKKASYEGHTAHSGEYEGPRVKEELERLMRWCQFYS